MPKLPVAKALRASADVIAALVAKAAELPALKAAKIAAGAVAAVIALVVAGWLIDDVWLGGDLPRGASVAEVDVARLSRQEAHERLEAAGLDQRRIELVWAGETAAATAAELGVSVDIESALDSAAERGSFVARPYRWLGSLFSGSNREPAYELDSQALADFFGAGPAGLFELDFGHPQIGLVDGEFAELDARSLPVVDVSALRAELLDAAAQRSADTARIEVPTAGSEAVDRGAAALIAQASAMSERGIGVRLASDYRSYRIPADEVRQWITFGFSGSEPEIGLDGEAVMAALRERFDDSAVRGESVEFFISPFTDRVYLSGGTPTMTCCEPGAAADILAALRDPQHATEPVIVRPIEDPAAEGSLAFFESLGITELVGEFTTYFAPGQSRVTNIARISELTQGAIIVPGETFSVNDYVGVRTRAKGFVSAGMISDGVFVPSVGGGISQYATTLFNAAFFAGLDFGEYQSHSIYLSRYPYGREATVSHPRPDLQIVNNTPYAVLIWPTTTDTSITVKLFSTRWAVGEQTGQSREGVGQVCTLVTTERTRTFFADDRTEIDYVTALYRPTGLRCDGSSSVPTSSTTTTTVPDDADPDPDAETPTTTSVAGDETPTTTEAAPDPPEGGETPTTTEAQGDGQ